MMKQLVAGIAFAAVLAVAGEADRFASYKAARMKDPGLARYYTFEEGWGEEVRNDAPAEPGKMALSGGPRGSLYIVRNTPYGVSRRSYVHVLDDTPAPEWTAGRFPGKGALTNGLLQRCVFRSGFQGRDMGAFSLAMWVRFHGEDRRGTCDIVGVSNGHGAGFAVSYSRGPEGKWSTVNFRLVAAGKPVAVNIADVAAGTWQNIVLVNTGSAIEAYLNGQPVASCEYTGEYTVPGEKSTYDAYLRGPYMESRDSGFLTIGGRKMSNSGDLRFDLDELAVYARALAADEIARNYEQGKPDTSPADQLAAFQALRERQALLDQIRMTIPADSWGYFPAGQPIPATVTVSPAVAAALGADAPTAVFTLWALDGSRLWEKREPLAAKDGALAAAVTVTPETNGVYFLDMRLVVGNGQLIKRLPEMYCLGIAPAPPTGAAATKDIPIGLLAVTDAWTYGAPVHRIFSYPVLDDRDKQQQSVAALVARVDHIQAQNPDLRPFVCTQLPWPKKLTVADREALAFYFTGVATAMKGRVWAWEISNEPNGKVSPEVYMEMLKIASPILREITPGVPIVAPGASPSGLPFIKSILQQGAEDYIDIVSFHNYAASQIYVYHWRNQGKVLQEIVAETCERPLPIWNSESGILSLPRVGARAMTRDQALRAGFRMTNDTPARTAFVGSIPTLPEEHAAARQVQDMLLNLASGFAVYIKCQSPGMPIIEQTNTEALPTLLGVAVTALSTRLSGLARVTPLPLASLAEAGVFLDKRDGSRDAVLFSEDPVTMSFQAPPDTTMAGMDQLGNPRQWPVGGNGILTLAVDDRPVYVFNVPADFRQVTPLAITLPEALPENGILEGTVAVRNTTAAPLRATLAADPIQGATVALGASTVDLAPGAATEVPLRLTATQLKRRLYSVDVTLSAGDKRLAAASRTFSSPGVIVMVPELAAAPALDGDDAEWAGVPTLSCTDEDSVVHGKPNYAEQWLPQWRGPDDLSFTVKLAWARDAGVYFLLDVRDNTVMPAPPDDVGLAFRYDCLEFFFDGRKYGERGGPVSIGADQAVVVPATGEAPAPCTFWMARRNEEQVKIQLTCVGRATPTGYRIEGRLVPKPDLDFRLLPGSQFAMDFLVDDMDAAEAPRKAAMALNGTFNNSTDSSTWGRYELAPDK